MLQKEKLKANKKIEIIWDSVVEDVMGTEKPKTVSAIKIKNVKNNKLIELKIDGLFIAIGHDPAASLFRDQLKMDKEVFDNKPDSLRQTYLAYLPLEMLKTKSSGRPLLLQVWDVCQHWKLKNI